MKIKCEYCGNYLSDTDEKCPNCQAPNENLKRVGNEVPQTIDELKTWYEEHNLPPEETTRFFIGKDIKEPKAFGIYKDDKNGNYVVYKNKSTGERAVRYEGKDEAYAVNELYMKLKEEIQNQKELNDIKARAQEALNRQSTYQYTPPRRSVWDGIKKVIGSILLIAGSILIIPMICLLIGKIVSYSPGYYEVKNSLLYLYSNCSKKESTKCEWYIYNAPADEWAVLANKEIVVKPKYGGRTWDKSNRLYKKYNVKTQYYEFDWYKELHPPTPTKGYYNYNDQMYYYYYGWYIYNNGWQKTTDPPGDIVYNPDGYYDSYATNNDTYDFEDSSYYSGHSSSRDDDSWSSSDYDNDDWDSGSSWDSSDSWDSGGTDWDSDW